MSLISKIRLWRLRRHAIRKAAHIGDHVLIKKRWNVTKGVTVEDYVLASGEITVTGAGKLNIGHHTCIGPDLYVITSNHNFDDATKIPYDAEDVVKNVEIGPFVWLGARCMILPGTKIGEGAIIQGGSVVHGEIPPCAIAGGNPAKVFAYRNKEKFYNLKAAGKYSGGKELAR